MSSEKVVIVNNISIVFPAESEVILQQNSLSVSVRKNSGLTTIRYSVVVECAVADECVDLERSRFFSARSNTIETVSFGLRAGAQVIHRNSGRMGESECDIESQMTEVIGSDHFHQWTVYRQINRQWVSVQCTTLGGIVGWEEIEPEWSRIIQSIRPIDDLASGTTPLGTELATTTESDALEWLACDGGPHLLLPVELADAWTGFTGAGPGPVVHGDYARAIAVDEPFGIVDVGSGGALVLAGDPALTGCRVGDGGRLVDLFAIDELAGLYDELVDAASPELDRLSDSGWRLRLTTPGLVLLFAGEIVGETAYGQIEIGAPAGEYAVLTGRYEGEEGVVRLARLRRIG